MTTPNTPVAQPVDAPFKVGDRVRNKYGNWPEATVTAITKRGFKYEFDKPVNLGPRQGSMSSGEAYREGFAMWEVASVPQPVDEGGAPDVNAVWREVHDSLNREGKWTAGETGVFYAFFLSGWNHRGMADTLARASPADIKLKAQRAAETIWNQLDRSWAVSDLADIIVAEFTRE